MGECFNCRNREEKRPLNPEVCRKGHKPLTCKSVKDLSMCPDFSPCVGFQIGGYWSHMWFTSENPGHVDACLRWHICSDGEFPTETPGMSFHICSFVQLEKFVEFWRWELERQGCISPRQTSEEDFILTEKSLFRNIIITKGENR